jgi:hypothetical protein
MDVGQSRDSDDCMGDSIQCAQDIEALPPARGFDPTPRETPYVTEQGAEDKMGRIHKKDGAFTRLRFG